MSAVAPPLSLRATEVRPPAVIVALGVMFLPMLRPSWQGNATPVDLLFALAILTTLLWAGTTGIPLRLPFGVAVAVFVGSGALAAGLGSFPTQGVVALAQDLALFAWCAALANVCRTPQAMATVLRAWVWSAVAWGGLLLVGAVAGLGWLTGQIETGGRAVFTFDSPNQAGNYFAISLLVLLASRTPRRRSARVAAALVLFAATLLAASNAALGGLAVGLLASGLIALAQRHGVMPAIGALASAVLVCGVVVFFAVQTDLLGAARHSSIPLIKNTLGRSERSAGDRLQRFQQLQTLQETGGLLGYGPSSTKPVLASELLVGQPKEAHNDYGAALVERGVFGVLGLLLLIGTMITMCVGLARRPLRPEFAEILPRTGPIIGAALLIAIGGLSHEVLHFRHVWALFGLLAALHYWAREPAPGRLVAR